jgi:hypothetical protein
VGSEHSESFEFGCNGRNVFDRNVLRRRPFNNLFHFRFPMECLDVVFRQNAQQLPQSYQVVQDNHFLFDIPRVLALHSPVQKYYLVVDQFSQLFQ